jgi:hypothetical protein
MIARHDAAVTLVKEESEHYVSGLRFCEPRATRG